jgi:hypothetical protein
VRGRSVSGREAFSGDDEGGSVRTKVLEEVGQAVEEDEGLLSGRGREEDVVGESHDAAGDKKREGED